MKPDIHIISIAVADLERAIAFYRDGLGWPCWSHPANLAPVASVNDETQDHAAFAMNSGLSFVLYQREALARSAQESETKKGSTEFLLTCYVEQEAELQIMLDKALAAGGKQLGTVNQESWGTTAHFRDLDGHLWEIMWNRPNGD